jgi:hypothetical protein
MPRSTGKSSFLDEWLDKHKSATSPSLTPPTAPNLILSPSTTLPPQPLHISPIPTPTPQEIQSPITIPKTQPIAEPAVKINPPTEISSPARLHATKVSADSSPDSSHENTIYIDRDGNLQSDYKEP